MFVIRSCAVSASAAPPQATFPLWAHTTNVTPTDFTLDPARVLFVLHETHFASPPDWHLQLIEDPRGWFNEMRAAGLPL